VGALGGEAAEINEANVRDLSQLCDEFKFIELAETVGNWQAEHPHIDLVTRRELDLVRAELEERLKSQDRTILMLDRALRRLQENGIHDAEKVSALEAEVSGLRSLLGETAASVEKAARDIDQGKGAAADQRMAHVRDICALEEEVGRVGKAVATIRTSLGREEGEWRAAIGDLHKKAAQERSEVSGLKEVLGNIEGKQEKLQETAARQGDEVAETIRRNSELGGRVQQLEEENRLVRKSSAGLKDHASRVEAGQQSAVARLQETITAGGSKVKEDLSNVQGELAKIKKKSGGWR
jgi:chromosome segregation ATPase